MDRLTQRLGCPWHGNELTIEQIEAITDLLNWLDGMTPSERMRLEDEYRRRLQIFEWHRASRHYRHRSKKGGNTEPKRAATLANFNARSRFSRTRPAAYRADQK